MIFIVCDKENINFVVESESYNAVLFRFIRCNFAKLPREAMLRAKNLCVIPDRSRILLVFMTKH